MPGLEGGTARIRTTPHTVATPSNTQIHQVSDTHLLNPAELASDLLCQAKADMTCVKKERNDRSLGTDLDFRKHR